MLVRQEIEYFLLENAWKIQIETILISLKNQQTTQLKKNNIKKKIEYNAPSVNEMFFIWLKEVKQTSFQGYLIFFFLETSNDTYYIYLHIFYALRAFFKNDN